MPRLGLPILRCLHIGAACTALFIPPRRRPPLPPPFPLPQSTIARHTVLLPAVQPGPPVLTHKTVTLLTSLARSLWSNSRVGLLGSHGTGVVSNDQSSSEDAQHVQLAMICPTRMHRFVRLRTAISPTRCGTYNADPSTPYSSRKSNQTMVRTSVGDVVWWSVKRRTGQVHTVCRQRPSTRVSHNVTYDAR